MKQNGFTLMETLIVIGVIAILIAVSIPAAMQMKKSLDMTRLDQAAKTIYTELQDNITRSKAAGTWDAFAASLPETDRLDVLFGRQPAETDAALPLERVYRFSSESTDLHSVVTSDTFYTQIEGAWVAEVDAVTAVTVSVYYSNTMTPGELLSAYDGGLYDLRTKASRRGIPVGCYCSADAEPLKQATILSPRVTCVNGEELYCTVTCADVLPYSTDGANLTVALTLRDEHGGEKTFTYSGIDPAISWQGDELSVSVLLDSMAPGCGFADLTGLQGGDVITAACRVRYTGSEPADSDPAASGAHVVFHSWFADESDGSSLAVNRLRHLTHLDAWGREGITSVRLTADIDWDDSAWAQAEWCPGSVQENPLSAFIPMHNELLFGGAAQGAADFDGGGHTLRGMVIMSSAEGTGLWATANTAIRDLTLLMPKVRGRADTGALVGFLTGGTVDGCGVRLDAPASEAALSAGTLGGTDAVGGLVGRMVGGVISDSYAAIPVSGDSSVGGLVGLMGGGRVTGSYASGDVLGTEAVGGLLGRVTDGTAEHCYSVSDVSGSDRVGGFAGSAEAGSLAHDVSYGSVTGTGTAVGGFAGSLGASLADTAYLRQFRCNDDLPAQDEVSVPRSFPELAAEANSAADSHPYADALQGSAFPFPMAAGIGSHYGNWPEEVALRSALIYYERYAGDSGGSRYGYYGRGRLTGIGGYTWTLDTLASETELSAEGTVLVEDGYALLTPYSLETLLIRKDGGAAETLTGLAALETDLSLPFDAGSEEAYTLEGLQVLRLPFAYQMAEPTDGFYTRLSMTGFAAGNSEDSVFADCAFDYDPLFARTAVCLDSPEAPASAAPATAVIRSARQLNALGRAEAFWDGTVNFHQELSLYYDAYTSSYGGVSLDLNGSGAYGNRPIGSPETPFCGDFNGDGYDILDLRLSSDRQAVGLFGAARDGALRNIHLSATRPADNTGTVISTYAGASGAVGALVGSLGPGGSVANCTVSGYTVTAGGSGHMAALSIGGLMGTSAGSVSRSTAVCKTVSASSSGAISMGGLAGSVTAGTVRDSYAGGTLKPVGDLGTVGGIAGSVSNTVSASYSYCAVDGSAASALTVCGVAPQTEDCFYFADILGRKPEPCEGTAALNYDQLTELWIEGEHGYGSAAYSIPWSPALWEEEYGYPFPAIVTARDGEFVHYGDWPDWETWHWIEPEEEEEDEKPPLRKGTIGFFCVASDGLLSRHMEFILLNFNDLVLSTDKEFTMNSLGAYVVYNTKDTDLVYGKDWTLTCYNWLHIPLGTVNIPGNEWMSKSSWKYARITSGVGLTTFYGIRFAGAKNDAFIIGADWDAFNYDIWLYKTNTAFTTGR